MSQAFTVGNFNLRNLVPASDEEAYHFFYGKSLRNAYWKGGEGRENTYDKKVSWLASQLDRMNADIVCFEEVFDQQPLQDVIDHSRYRGRSSLKISGEAVTEETEYQGKPATLHFVPRMGLMVTEGYEVVKFKSLKYFPSSFDFSEPVTEESGRKWKVDLFESGEVLNQFNRPIVKARVRLPKRFVGLKSLESDQPAEITLFIAHLKSKRPIQLKTRDSDPVRATMDYLREEALGKTRSLLLRGLEAAALRTYVLEELKRNPHRPVVVLGDLNDGPRGVTTEVAGGLSLPVLNSGVEPDFDKREKMFHAAADFALYSAYDLQTQRTHRDVYYTHVFDGFHDTLDHVLVSSHFVPKWARDGKGRDSLGKVGTLRVFNDHLINADVDDIKSHKVGKYLHTRSDHGQVTVRLDWF